MLIGTGIRKTFGGKDVLHGVDVSIAPGQITALIGPSGGGKSTLLRALSLLDRPDSGTITVDDVVYEFPEAERQRFCTTVAQGDHRFSAALLVAAFDDSEEHHAASGGEKRGAAGGFD